MVHVDQPAPVVCVNVEGACDASMTVPVNPKGMGPSGMVMHGKPGAQSVAACSTRLVDSAVAPLSESCVPSTGSVTAPRGGMGRVVAAVDTMLEREVAIKQALGGDVDAARFEREARITAQLEHASIVPVHDAGRDEHGRPYYVMRRIAGEPLADRISAAHDAKARLALVPRFAIAVDAAAFAHARGIVHRDIKPWNILLGAYGETLLIDWGLARRLDEPDDGRDHAAGTPGYMAPEQARGAAVDARADVYALGATLLDVLTGALGRGLSSPTRWIARADAGTLPPIEQLAPEIPAELVAIVAKALAPEPADRYRDAGELAADLHAFLDGRIVAAHRYTVFERALRFVRRHRVVVAIAAVALVVVALTTVLAIRGVIDERDVARAARRDAEAERRLAADRADVLLLDRAAGLVERDPTFAAALLATLPPGSQHAARARDIAAIAALHGIAHGRVAHDGAVIALAMAPDGRTALSAGGRDETIAIHDFATGTLRTIARRSAVESAIWADGGATVVYATRTRELRVVDVATAAARVIASGLVVAKLWAPGDGDRIRVHDATHHAVTEFPTVGGEPHVLARDVAVATAWGELLVVAGAGAVRTVDGSGEHVVARYTGADPGELAISGDGARVAAAFPDGVIEWHAATGKRVAAWAGIGPAILYAGTSLYGANRHRNGQLDLLIAAGSHQALAANWSLLWSTRAGPRTALVNPSGDLALVDDSGYRELRFDRPGTRMVAGRPDSPYLVAGATDGTVRWWDLRQFAPESHRVPNGALCGIDAQRIYVRGTGTLAIIPRAGGDATTVDVPGLWCLGDHAGSVVVNALPSGGEQTFAVVDGATARARYFTGEPLIGPHGIYFVRDRSLFEVTAREPLARWTAPAPILGVVATEQAFGFELPGQLVRLDPATRATAVFAPVGQPSLFQLGVDGSWWYAIGSRIYHGDRAIGELPLPARVLWLAPGGDGMLLTTDRSIWRAGPRGLERAVEASATQAIATGRRALATLSRGMVRTTYLDTGERLSIPARDATDVQLFDDDHLLAIVRIRDYLVIDLYSDPVPADPNKLAGWLAAATNAVVAPGNDAVTWR